MLAARRTRGLLIQQAPGGAGGFAVAAGQHAHQGGMLLGPPGLAAASAGGGPGGAQGPFAALPSPSWPGLAVQAPPSFPAAYAAVPPPGAPALGGMGAAAAAASCVSATSEAEGGDSMPHVLNVIDYGLLRFGAQGE